MKSNFISSRKMAIINTIISCAISAISAIFIQNDEARIFLIAIFIVSIGFYFIARFYFNQLDKGMPHNVIHSPTTHNF